MLALISTILAALLFPSVHSWAQQPPDKDPNNAQAQPGQVTVHIVGAGPGMAVGGGGGGGGGAMAIAGGGNAFVMPFAGGPGMFGRDALAPVVMVLGDLNLAPEFSLSPEQKQKIQSVRDDFKQATDMWRAQHDDELKQLDEQQKEIFQNMQNGGGPPDPDQMQQMMEQRRQIMETAPSGEEQATQVKAVLTADQLKQFEAKQAAIDEERQAMMQRMPIRVMHKEKDGKGR